MSNEDLREYLEAQQEVRAVAASAIRERDTLRAENAKLRDALRLATDRLEAFVDMFQSVFVSPDTPKKLRTGKEVEVLNIANETIKDARAILDDS